MNFFILGNIEFNIIINIYNNFFIDFFLLNLFNLWIFFIW